MLLTYKRSPLISKLNNYVHNNYIYYYVKHKPKDNIKLK